MLLSSCSEASALADSCSKKVDNMKNTLARHIINLHPVPHYAVVLALITSVILLLIHFVEMGWQLLLVVILLLLAWSPIFFYTMRALYRHYRWVAFFCVLLCSQSVRFLA